MLDHAESIRHLEVMKDPPRRDEFEETRKLAQYWKSRLRIMKTDGSRSWIVISRWMNKYVNELPEENGKSSHYEEVVTGTERPVATKQKEQSSPPLPSLSTMVVPIDQRKWKDIPAVDYVDKGSLSFSVSKTMTRILRHRGLHRETNGAMDCFLFHCFVAITGTPWDGRIMSGWIICIKESTRNYFSIACTLTASSTTCVPSKVTLEETNVEPSLLEHLKITYMWSEYIYHVGSPLCILSPTQDWLQEEKIQKKEDKQYFSQPQPWILWPNFKKKNCINLESANDKD